LFKPVVQLALIHDKNPLRSLPSKAFSSPLKNDSSVVLVRQTLLEFGFNVAGKANV
jgi:hypothetical protein